MVNIDLRLNIIIVLILLFQSCENSAEKENISLFANSTVITKNQPNVINNKSVKIYSVLEGKNLVMEYVREYDEINSIDEEYWTKLLIEFDEKSIDFSEEYSIENDKVKVFAQSGSFDGLLNFKLVSGNFQIKKKRQNLYTLSVLKDLIGNNNGINLVFIKRGDYEFATIAK